MKKIITALFSLAAISFAADVQVLPPTGADFATDAPDMVQSNAAHTTMEKRLKSINIPFFQLFSK